MSLENDSRETFTSDSGESTLVENSDKHSKTGKKDGGVQTHKSVKPVVPHLTVLSESRQPVIPHKHWVHNKPHNYTITKDAVRYVLQENYDVVNASNLCVDIDVPPLSVQITSQGCAPLDVDTTYPNLTSTVYPVALPQETSLVPVCIYLRKSAPNLPQLKDLGDPITSVCREFNTFSCSERIVLTKTVGLPEEGKACWIQPAPRWYASKTHRLALEKGGTVQELAKEYHQFLPVSHRPLSAFHLEPAHERDCFCGACPSIAVQSPLVNPVLNLSLREPHNAYGSRERIEEQWTLLTLNALHERDQCSMRLRDYTVKLNAARCLEDVKHLYHLINRAQFCYEIARLLHHRSHNALTQLRRQIAVLDRVRKAKPAGSPEAFGLLTILREDSQNYATRYLQDRMQLAKAYSQRFSKHASHLLYILVVRNLYPVITHGHGAGRPSSSFAKYSPVIPIRPAPALFPHTCAKADRGCDAQLRPSDPIIELGMSSLEFAMPSKLVGRSPDVTPPDFALKC